mmetsp:Transcript_81956/g.244429  ORF Transcript_81956/g.244429 Transcript_81956/m.244429 type:complete len:320 (+) Transcript_81956:49-1008(+)
MFAAAGGLARRTGVGVPFRQLRAPGPLLGPVALARVLPLQGNATASGFSSSSTPPSDQAPRSSRCGCSALRSGPAQGLLAPFRGLQPLTPPLCQASGQRPISGLGGSLRSLAPSPPATSLLGPRVVQARGAGRTGGFKRKRKAVRPRTVHQKGLGKRMEFFWPRPNAHRTRIPMYENSRQHVIFDHSRRRWMVMWYRNGIQVFRAFKARHGYFEQGRAKAILFFKQLQHAGKLGRPKPDQCRSGVRGVYFDKEERAWVARWSDCGLKKYAVYGTQEMGFAEAYRAAVHTRIQSVRQNHQFILQRTRWKGQRRPLGTPQT